MSTHNDHGHLSAERIQAFLEEELPKREHRFVEEHLEACARCSSELAAWQAIFADLGALRSHRPHEGFADRVMTNVRLPEPRSFPERIRSRAAAMLGLGESGHVDGTLAQDLVDGLLPGRQAARVRRHIERCGPCADQVEGFARIVSGLADLPRFEPSAAFADHVMARVALAPQVAPERVTEPRGWLAAARRLVPRTRRAWAALSGAAVTPVATIGLVVYAVFSHPTLTVESLLSYVSWQVADLAAMGWGAMVGLMAQGVAALGLRDLLGAAASAPMAIAGASVLYSVLVVMALRVLYKNLVTARSVDIRNA